MKYPQAKSTSITGRRAYSVHEAAELYPVSPQFIRQRIADGSLRARKIGRRVLVLDADLVAFFEESPETPKNARGGKH